MAAFVRGRPRSAYAYLSTSETESVVAVRESVARGEVIDAEAT